MKELLNGIRRVWGHLVQLACWIAVAVGTFLPQPPLMSLTAPPDRALRYFAQFIGAVLLGVIYILCLRWDRKEHVRRWILVIAVSLIVTMGAFFGERAARAAWTCDFAGRVITIGGRLTSDAAAYQKQVGHSLKCHVLLNDYGGDPSEVWEGAEFRYFWLSALMLTVWLGASISIMSVSQAIRIASAEPLPRNGRSQSAKGKSARSQKKEVPQHQDPPTHATP
jgi:uncharacterized membrane protein HdeD (DUF308 family)